MCMTLKDIEGLLQAGRYCVGKRDRDRRNRIVARLRNELGYKPLRRHTSYADVEALCTAVAKRKAAGQI